MFFKKRHFGQKKAIYLPIKAFFCTFAAHYSKYCILATFISLFIGCLSIGIILSAPMGPIGILTVQRTLNKGRVSGWFTGLGAAASDLFYCLLTGLGISFVTDYIEDNVTMLQENTKRPMK